MQERAIPPQPNSRQVAFRFVFRLILLTALATVGSQGFGKTFAVLLALSAVFCTVTGAMRRETMPPQAMLARRMEALTLGVLGQLGATANWHRIAREWLFNDAPSTELGELEQPFHTRAAA